MQQLMTRMQQMSPGDLERTYLQTMIQGHVGAIQISRLAQRKADHAQLRDFARRVADEETQMNSMFAGDLRDWYNVRLSTAMQQAMPMDQDVYNRLRNLSGRDFEVAYMQAMITSFTEAINMSQQSAPRFPHADLRNVVTGMASAHTQERAQLVSWLSSWYNVSVR
jgi:uncharacterized protein (DUF305 family)